LVHRARPAKKRREHAQMGWNGDHVCLSVKGGKGCLGCAVLLLPR